MRIAIGCDHKGFPLKSRIAEYVSHLGHQVVICGTYSDEPVDFPDITAEVCSRIAAGDADKVILLCSTGVGAVMAANKLRGVRATLCSDTYSAHQAVEHDDANALCLGADIVGPLLAEEIIAAFLAAEFDTSEEFVRRVAKLNALDSR